MKVEVKIIYFQKKKRYLTCTNVRWSHEIRYRIIPISQRFSGRATVVEPRVALRCVIEVNFGKGDPESTAIREAFSKSHTTKKEGVFGSSRGWRHLHSFRN